MATEHPRLKPTILVQLDTDPLPSVFDRVVAVDAGADLVFSYGGVTPENVMPLVHGCIFTRGGPDLARTALFIGGSDALAAEKLLEAVRSHLLPKFGLSVSVLLDPNGANTTAAAAVQLAGQHLPLDQTRALVLGGTGPVGQRVAHLLARAGAEVRVGSRQKDRAEAVCQTIRKRVPNATVEAVAVASSTDAPAALAGRELVVAAGAPGTLLLPKKLRTTVQSLRVAIDLNGVPPAGIEGVELTDKATMRDGVLAFGALGVGGTKMRLHTAAIRTLFMSKTAMLDVDEVMALSPN